MSKFLPYVAGAVSVYVKLWLVEAQNLTALGGTVYDDRLFINNANALLQGHWLGPYSNTVLAKGPFYPMWIALMSRIGVPLLLSQHLLYIASCLIIVVALRPVIKSLWVLLLFFVLLMFNPMSFMSGIMTQVIREGIYPALTLLVFACGTGLYIRMRGAVPRAVPWAGGLGLALAALWLTREEGLWIVPGVLFILGATAFSGFKVKPAAWRRVSLLLLPFVLFFAVILSVSYANKVRYHVFGVTDMKSPDFLEAYGALLRVKNKNWKPIVPVPENVREKLYEVSPAFAELKPTLSGEAGRRWTRFFDFLRECSKKDPEVAGYIDQYFLSDVSGVWRTALYDENSDIYGGAFVWAFRDAVSVAGHYVSGKTAADYYRRLASEINAACSDGRLECGPARASLMPSWHSEYAVPFLKSLVFGATSLVRLTGFDVNPAFSNGDPDSLRLFREITGETLSPSEFVVRGWAFSPPGRINLSIRTSEGDLIGPPVKLLPSPDVHKQFLSGGRDFPEALEARFDIRGRIADEFLACKKTCFMHIEKDGVTVRRVPLDGTTKYIQGEDVNLQFDFLGLKDGPSGRDKIKIRMLGAIGEVYRYAVPLFAVMALAVYAARIVKTRAGNPLNPAGIISSFSVIAVLCRLSVLSLIHVTSFPAILPNYLAPAYPLVLIFVLLTFQTHESGISLCRKNIC